MTKREFVDSLQRQLSGLPKEDIDERVAFYCEIIDDRVEEGATEEEAVSAIGSVGGVVEEILKETSFIKIAKERIKPKRRLKGWEIALIAVGAPIWFSVTVAAIAVVVALYVVLWSAVISLWAIFASLAACAVGGVIAGGASLISGGVYSGIAMIGMGLVCAGFAILIFFGSRLATRGIAWVTAKIALGIKKLFVGKESK